MRVCVCVCVCVCVYVRKVFFPQYLEESFMEFHQIMQTLSYVQGRAKDKYYYELFPFVILNDFGIDIFFNILKSH